VFIGAKSAGDLIEKEQAMAGQRPKLFHQCTS